jgi:hypothetical protein
MKNTLLLVALLSGFAAVAVAQPAQDKPDGAKPELTDYVGTYGDWEVKIEDGRLVMEGPASIDLQPTGEPDTFTSPRLRNRPVKFVRDESGVVTEMVKPVPRGATETLARSKSE